MSDLILQHYSILYILLQEMSCIRTTRHFRSSWVLTVVINDASVYHAQSLSSGNFQVLSYVFVIQYSEDFRKSCQCCSQISRSQILQSSARTQLLLSHRTSKMSTHLLPRLIHFKSAAMIVVHRQSRYQCGTVSIITHAQCKP